MTKSYVCRTPYLRTHTLWLSFMEQICKMISPVAFFNVKILIFHFVKGAERAKNGPKWWKFLSVGSYIIWSSFIAHMYIWEGGKRAKNLPKSQKIISVSLPISGTIHHICCNFWHTCVKWWYLQQIFSFFKILIFRFIRRVKGRKKDLILAISVCFALYEDFDNDILQVFFFICFLNAAL